MPTKDEFFSILTQEGITNEQYQHAQQLWDTFKMKSMGEYHHLSLAFGSKQSLHKGAQFEEAQ